MTLPVFVHCHQKERSCLKSEIDSQGIGTEYGGSCDQGQTAGRGQADVRNACRVSLHRLDYVRDAIQGSSSDESKLIVSNVCGTASTRIDRFPDLLSRARPKSNPDRRKRLEPRHRTQTTRKKTIWTLMTKVKKKLLPLWSCLLKGARDLDRSGRAGKRSIIRLPGMKSNEVRDKTGLFRRVTSGDGVE